MQRTLTNRTNMQNDPPIYNTQAHHSLGMIYTDVAAAVGQVSDFISNNPEVDPKKVKGLNEQLGAMFQAIDAIGIAHQKLDYAMITLGRELERAGADNQCRPICNLGAGIPTYNSFTDISKAADRGSR